MDAEAQAAPLDPGLIGQFARPVPGVENGYLAGYRVRFDEAGPDGLLRTSALMRYAQDIAWRHSEQLGFDRDWYASRGLGSVRVMADCSSGHLRPRKASSGFWSHVC